MTRAYLRLDPNIVDRKAEYPDGAYRAYIECLCFAEQQPTRGRFRNEKLLRVLLEKRSRWVPYLIAHGDLVLRPGGSLYVDGWDEWQEGDVTVAERMRRLRNRHTVADTPGDTPTVTPDVTAGTVTVPSSGGGSGKRLANSGGGSPSPDGSPQTFMGYRPKPGSHEGQHPDCSVCDTMRPKPRLVGDSA